VKRFAVFGGATYYPGQGWDDFRGAFDTLEEACAKALLDAFDWWQVVHLETLTVAAEGNNRSRRPT
jgi:hypothetical protein